MATRMGRQFGLTLDQLRYEPTAKRVRAVVGDRTVVDTHNALLVWEPRRVVPSYAVSAADLKASLRPADSEQHEENPVTVEGIGPKVLDPSTAFGVHSCEGVAMTIDVEDLTLPGAAFQPDDRDLAGYVILDFEVFTWLQEDEPLVAHPRDPFTRIDVHRSSRHVRVESDGVTLAESDSLWLLFETYLPTRYYFEVADVRMDLLIASDKTTACAYKGFASHWTADVGARVLTDIAWTYHDPLHDASPIAGRVAFYTERLDLTLDGEPQKRPITPWS